MKIRVKVKTNSGRQSVEKIPEDIFSEEGFEGLYFVKLKSTPEGNKANIELLKVLSRHFGCEVKIKSGFTSKKKIVEVFDGN